MPTVSRLIIKGGTVLTMAGANHAAADVLVEDGWISEIGPNLRDRGAEVVDASDAIVMPGFVDAHRHLSTTLHKNAGSGRPDPATAGSMGVDDVYAATLLGLLGAAASGTTSVVDRYDATLSTEHVDAALRAHVDAGLRTVLVIDIADDAGHEQLRRLGATETSPLQALAAGAPDPAGDPAATAAAIARARELGLRAHAHAGRGADSKGSVAALADMGALGDDVTLVHCTQLGDTDLDAVASAGAHVVITPSTEMAEGIGMPPVQQFLDREIRPGLGVDVESLAPGDVLAQMRSMISLQHAMYFDLKLAGKAGLPNLLTTREVIRNGTIHGARAAGLADRAGSLEAGKRADVVVLRTDRPNIFPINDPIGAVVWGMDTSNIDWVLVAGTPVVADGRSTADVGRASDLATEAARRLVGTGGGGS